MKGDTFRQEILSPRDKFQFDVNLDLIDFHSKNPYLTTAATILFRSFAVVLNG